jgi:hypothetical protein
LTGCRTSRIRSPSATARASTSSNSGGDASSTMTTSTLRQLCATIDRTAVISPSSGRYAVITTDTRCGASTAGAGGAVSRSNGGRPAWSSKVGRGSGNSARNAASHGAAGRSATNGFSRSTSSASRAGGRILR